MSTTSPDLLPDSRAREAKDRLYTPTGAWIPFFCANCGKECGRCPEENMTFLFYLCPKCFETHGPITATMAVPDKIFFDRIAGEQQEAHGRALTHAELVQVVQEDSSPLATLLKEAK
jgi:predicted RNA-binding Zn-ribbon protein involved in translation (DUF1610 family)